MCTTISVSLVTSWYIIPPAGWAFTGLNANNIVNVIIETISRVLMVISNLGNYLESPLFPDDFHIQLKWNSKMLSESHCLKLPSPKNHINKIKLLNINKIKSQMVFFAEFFCIFYNFLPSIVNPNRDSNCGLNDLDLNIVA